MNLKLFETWAKSEGVLLYAEYSEDEQKLLAALGVHPYAKTMVRHKKMIAQFEADEGREPTPGEKSDMARLMAVGAMQAANAGPHKMRV